MLATCLSGLLILAAAPPAEEPAALRTVSFFAETEKGEPVTDLQAADVAVLENGTAREIARVERDERPLTVLILLDSSEELGSSLRLNLTDAVAALVAALPEGTRYAIWKTGDRPTRLVDFTSDPAEAGLALKRIFPQGGNTFLDGLAEGARALRKQEGARSAVVAVTGTSTELSSRSRETAVHEALGQADVFHVLRIDEGAANEAMRVAYDQAIADVTTRSGGRREFVLHSMAARKPLLAIAAELRQSYRVSYASEPGLARRQVVVQVARPGARVRVSPPREDR